jgi:RHS repeat-associated protein
MTPNNMRFQFAKALQRSKRILALMVGAAAIAVTGPASAQSTVYRPTSTTQTDTTTITTPYPTNGRTRTWTYTWSPTGQLLTVDGPLPGSGDTTTYTYNTSGFLASVTDPMGHVTTVTAWNGRGKPATIVDPNGVSTTFTYDVQDRPLTITFDPGANQSQYVLAYDAVGDVTQITLPEGGYLTYTYDDGRRLTQIANDRGETQNFTPSPTGDPTAVAVATSGSSITNEQTYAYDELGRVIQAVGAASQTTGLAYNKVDDLTGLTDARGKLYQNSYDALDRLITQINPQSQSIQLGYSPSDELNDYKDGRTLETTRVVDGFGQVIMEVSPDRGTTTYWYDEAGNVTKTVDGDGQETDYAYDAASRLTSTSYAGASAETITYTYDSVTGGNVGMDRLTGVSEQSGTSAFVYDNLGRIVQDTKVIQGETYALGYAYDRNSRVTQITLPSGRTVTFTRTSEGQVSGISTAASGGGPTQTLASSVSYLPFGPMQSLTFGNGLNLTRTFDQNYWLGRIQVAATGATVLDLTFGRDADGELTGVTDNAMTGRGASFGYTDSARLNSATGPWGADTYTYDAAGNRTDKARVVGGVTSHETPILASTSNQVTQIQDGSGAALRNLTYRAGGDLSQDAAPLGSTYNYTYNARKRLVAVDNAGTPTGAYGYDFQGHRVWRTVYGTTTVQTDYVYDEAGHLLAEHDATTGLVEREYVWLDDMPVAMIDSTGTSPVTYFIHTGQIDEPLVMTDATQSKVWDAYVEPFGRAQVFGTPSAGLNLRLPGQFEQDEAGWSLNQNWNRDYDTTLGRYVEADPLGIGSGQNLYGYVDANPLNDSDLWGLQPEFTPTLPAGTMIAPYGERVVPLSQMPPSSAGILKYRLFMRDPGGPWKVGIHLPPSYTVAQTTNSAGVQNGFVWYPLSCPLTPGRNPINGVRIGFANARTGNPYFRVFNNSRQPISPVTGKTVPPQSNEAHYPLGKAVPSLLDWLFP